MTRSSNIDDKLRPIEATDDPMPSSRDLGCLDGSAGEQNSPKRILVVDDVPATTEMVSRVLSEQGYQVAAVEDGLQAYQIVKSNPPDLMILDWELPTMNGPKVCSYVKSNEETRSISVLMLTARNETQDVISGLNTGADDYMTKPFDELELIARVKALFRIKKLEWEIERRNRELQKANERLKELAIRDGLTRLYNHRHFQERLQLEYDRATRYDSDLAVILLDIDHFKEVNDTYGHIVGDRVLVETAQLIQDCIRKSDVVARDVVARYGGEEFVAILPEQALDGAKTVAERLRTIVASQSFDVGEDEPLQVTVSLGLALLRDHQVESASDLLQLADEALYMAKRTGRNRTVSAIELAQQAHSPP